MYFYVTMETDLKLYFANSLQYSASAAYSSVLVSVCPSVWSYGVSRSHVVESSVPLVRQLTVLASQHILVKPFCRACFHNGTHDGTSVHSN